MVVLVATEDRFKGLDRLIENLKNQVEGVSLGWGKESNGILKNKYPKGLRR